MTAHRELNVVSFERPRSRRHVYVSECAHTFAKETFTLDGNEPRLTIPQLQKAFLGDQRLRHLELDLTKHEADVVRFLITHGAIINGLHRWTAVRRKSINMDLQMAMRIDRNNIQRSIAQLSKVGLVKLIRHGRQELWATPALHAVGVEALWRDALWFAEGEISSVIKLLHWNKVSERIDKIFLNSGWHPNPKKAKGWDPTKRNDQVKAVRMLLIQVGDDVEGTSN